MYSFVSAIRVFFFALAVAFRRRRAINTRALISSRRGTAPDLRSFAPDPARGGKSGGSQPVTLRPIAQVPFGPRAAEVIRNGRGRPTSTAIVSAMRRAAHLLWDASTKIFADNFALVLSECADGCPARKIGGALSETRRGCRRQLPYRFAGLCWLEASHQFAGVARRQGLPVASARGGRKGSGRIRRMKCHSRIDLWIHDRDGTRRTGVRNLFVHGINQRRRFQNEWLTRLFLICMCGIVG